MVLVPGEKMTVEVLKEVRLMQSFDESELKTLVEIGEIKEYPTLSNIVIEGELGGGLFFLIQGAVSITKLNPATGNSYGVGQLREGAFFGEMSLIDHNTRSATVSSISHCVTFYLSKEKFTEFLSKDSSRTIRFYQACIDVLVQRLRSLDEQYVGAQYQLWKNVVSKKGKEVA